MIPPTTTLMSSPPAAFKALIACGTRVIVPGDQAGDTDQMDIVVDGGPGDLFWV